MTPERRDELRRADDAVKHARYTLDRKNYMATIEAQEDRIKALESLLAEAGTGINNLIDSSKTNIGQEYFFYYDDLISRIDAILPATEGDKNAPIP
jgi:hypothetical protein